jgi:nitronate monooxygenase
MHSALANLGMTSPVLAAPMAGGPTSPAMVVAAAAAGSLGFVAAGYKTPDLLAEQIREVRTGTPTFGVNLFAPNAVPIDEDEFRRYADAIQPCADRYDIDLREAAPREDDDWWQQKVDLLLADPVPVVSFTFGLPDAATVSALRGAGTVTVQTVTSADEAKRAVEAGVDMLAVQSSAAGGHWGTLSPASPPEQLSLTELVTSVRTVTALPVIAAGGLSTPQEVAATLQAGADAVAVGTVLLRSHESAASEVHKAALSDPSRDRRVLTRAFSGRPAGGLVNEFIERYDATAPLGYPAVHHLTSPIRKAAAAAGDPEAVNLWAGTGWRNATDEPVAAILQRLSASL